MLSKKYIEKLNKLFVDIIQGFSVIEIDDKKCYVKHSGIFDIENYNSKQKQFTSQAEEKGLMSKDNLLEFLESEDLWSKKEEAEIEAKTIEIKNLKNTIDNLLLEADKKNLKIRVQELSSELTKLLELRITLIKNTSEDYGEKKANEFFMFKSLFKDLELSELFFTEEEFLELDSSELANLYKNYNECLSEFSDENIKQLSINGHFANIFSLYSEDVSNFFKKHSIDLSFFQINLLNYAKLFKSILQNREIPKNIQGDAQKILEHIEKENKIGNVKQKIQEKASSSDGFSYAKATNKDLKSMGVNKKMGKDIHAIAKEKGGSLSMEDFMAIHKK